MLYEVNENTQNCSVFNPNLTRITNSDEKKNYDFLTNAQDFNFTLNYILGFLNMLCTCGKCFHCPQYSFVRLEQSKI